VAPAATNGSGIGNTGDVLLDCIALKAAEDECHATALRRWHTFDRSGPHLVTTSLVLDEVATFFNNRGRHAKAVEIVERLLGSRPCG
jgi:predicted nucleic acid-binding protein